MRTEKKEATGHTDSCWELKAESWSCTPAETEPCTRSSDLFLRVITMWWWRHNLFLSAMLLTAVSSICPSLFLSSAWDVLPTWLAFTSDRSWIWTEIQNSEIFIIFFKKDKQADSLSQNFACEQNSTTVITSETRPCLMDVQTRNIFHGSRISISVESSKSSHVTTASFLLSRVTLWLFTSLGCCSSHTHDEAVVSTNVCTHSVKWPSSTMFV